MGGYCGINMACDLGRTRVILSSQKDLHMGILKIYYVDYKCKSLVQLSQLDLRQEIIPDEIQRLENYLYFVKDWNIDLCSKGEPIILGFQFKSKQLMLSLKLDQNGTLEVVRDNLEVERDIFHSSVYHNQAVWAIDREGRIFKIEILD